MTIYAFEEADRALSCPPTAAQRALDLVGEKLSIEGWQSLSPADRMALVAAGALAVVDPVAVRAVLAHARPPSEPMPPHPDPDPAAPPTQLLNALGDDKTLGHARWNSLRPLDRYALSSAANSPALLHRAYDEIFAQTMSHLNASGEVRMVGVAAKPKTHRRAIATATVTMQPATLARLISGCTPKGDVLASARIAGIQAAKRTWELIPLCHPVALCAAEVQIDTDAIAPEQGLLRIRATVEAIDRTGVEMEALVAATTAALTLYDMLKGIDRWMTITDVGLLEKSGGRSGHLERGRAVTGPNQATRVDVRSEALSSDEAIALVSHAGAGGTAVFLGTVRHVNDGRAVTLLEYEAYASMARSEMDRIRAEIEHEIPGTRLCALHRVGALGVGDIAVICAASAPHRSEAFRACRLMIDRLKARVPVWKREHGPDGPYWVGWEDARCAPEHDHEHEPKRQP